MSDKLRVFQKWTMITNNDCRKLSRWSDQLSPEQFCAGRLENGQFPGSFGSCHGKGLTLLFFLLYLGLCKLEKAKNAENHIFRTKNVIFKPFSKFHFPACTTLIILRFTLVGIKPFKMHHVKAL